MKSPHLAALGWIIALGILAFFVLVSVANAYSYTDARELVIKGLLLGFAYLALCTAIVASLCGITLAGVRHFLNRALEIQRGERRLDHEAGAVTIPMASQRSGSVGIPDSGDHTATSPPAPVGAVEARTKSLIMSYLRQLLFDGHANAASGRDVADADPVLASYWSYNIDWYGLWRDASRRADGVSAFDTAPYWIANEESSGPVPLSTLAFWGRVARHRVANDPTTALNLLSVMTQDPSTIVSGSASAKLLLRRSELCDASS